MRLFLIMLFIFLAGNTARAQDTHLPNGTVASDGVPLRLRAGPGLHYSVLTLLDDGEPLLITGRNADGSWLEVIATRQNRPGWVYRDYVATALDLSTITLNTSTVDFRNLISGITPETRRIYQRGLILGNQPDRFAKVGDSITVSYNALYPIGMGFYSLDRYAYLQPVIDYFAGSSQNSFIRTSVAANVGWNAAAVLLPQFADPSQCHNSEMPLRCEYRLTHPAFALIMFGTNDVGYVPLSTYQHNMERIISISIEMGVVPVLSTIPPRTGYDERVNAFNDLIRQLSREYQIPLWDYGHAMSAYLPSSLGFDGVHPSLPPRGEDDAANFKQENLPYGYVLRNLSALHVLDALWQEVVLYHPERSHIRRWR